MTDQHRFAYADHFDHDLYTRTRTRDRVLNAAIVRADISESFEEYLEIFDAFRPAISRSVTRRAPNRFVEKRECVHFFLTFWYRFTSWLKSVVCRYPFERRLFLGMLQGRRIPPGRSTWSLSRAQPAL